MKHFPILRRAIQTMTLATLIVCANGFTQQVDPKQPIPDKEALGSTNKLIQEIYDSDFKAAQTSEQQLQLARKLFQVAKETAGDPVGQFVLLSKVRQLAAEQGDLQLALRAIDEIAKSFLIDALAEKAKTLGQIEQGESLESSSHRIQLARAALSLVELAISEDQYENAFKLIEIAKRVAGKSQDVSLLEQTDQSHREITKLQTEFKQVQEARATLGERPTDEGANLVVGKYFCFSKSDWDVGLLMLAMGSDAQLKKLAEQELQRPEDASEQMEIGDAWWEIAKKIEGRQRQSILLHAATWYRTALPNLAGLHKAKIEKRLLATIPSGVPNKPRLPDGAVLFMTFEKDTFYSRGSETLVRDLSGRGNHGLVQGATFTRNGKVGGALQFDGKDDIVLLPSLRNDLIKDLKGVTVCAWVQSHKPLSGWIFDVGEMDLVLRMSEEQPRQYLFQVPGAWSVTHTVAMQDWDFVAGVAEGTSVRVLVNMENRVRETSGPPPSLIMNMSNVANIPARIGGQGKTRKRNERFFRGLIDQVMVFDRALSNAELQALFDSGRLGQHPTTN